jgi:3-hydroxy acid dehydrogenase/malonic semialdehyde reductase
MGFHGNGRVAVITGASSGIGAATAQALSRSGFRLALGARRMDKLAEIAGQIEAETGTRPFTHELDVTSADSSRRFIESAITHFGTIHILVNNAGLAKGTTHVADAVDDADWQVMLDTNVMGLLRMTRMALPHILKADSGHIINLGSTAGHEAYAGGAVYCGTKFAVRAITNALRQELLGKPVRITSVDPGMVETEFSVVRYYGDEAAANRVYAGMTPLTAEDIADCVLFAATRPQHVNIDEIIVKPTDQASAGKVARESEQI